MAAALDMALDDVIGKTSRTGGGGGGKSSKGKGKRSSFLNRQRESRQQGGDDGGAKLDRSLDDLVESSRGFSKGKGKGGKGFRRFDDDWSSKGKGYGKNYGKGKNYSKGFGKDYSDAYRPAWDDHDDRDGNGGGKGGKKGGGWSARDDRFSSRGSDIPWGMGGRDEGRGAAGRLSSRDLFPVTHPERKAARPLSKVATSTGGFLRIEAEDEEDDGPRRRLGGVSRQMASARAAPAKRGRARDEDEDDDRRPRAKAAKTQKSATKMVKVTNIPKELKARDVREAFEGETGKIASCELGKGTAMITFMRAGDAVKAVDAFHKGELNGKIISVVLVQD